VLDKNQPPEPLNRKIPSGKRPCLWYLGFAIILDGDYFHCGGRRFDDFDSTILWIESEVKRRAEKQ